MGTVSEVRVAFTTDELGVRTMLARKRIPDVASPIAQRARRNAVEIFARRVVPIAHPAV